MLRLGFILLLSWTSFLGAQSFSNSDYFHRLQLEGVDNFGEPCAFESFIEKRNKKKALVVSSLFNKEETIEFNLPDLLLPLDPRPGNVCFSGSEDAILISDNQWIVRSLQKEVIMSWVEEVVWTFEDPSFQKLVSVEVKEGRVRFTGMMACSSLKKNDLKFYYKCQGLEPTF